MPETIGGIPTFAIMWGAAMILFVGFFTVVAIRKNGKLKKERKTFSEKHPDASKIYAMSKGVVTSDVVVIHEVDGEAPISLTEPGRSGILIAPGEHRIQISSTYTRPGVVYRSVSKSTGTVEKIINVKPYSVYDLTFDRKEGTFSFDERTESQK